MDNINLRLHSRCTQISNLYWLNPSENEEGVVNVHEPLGWCIKSEFVHGEVKNPIKLHRGKDCIEKFCQHIVCKAKRSCNCFPDVPTIPITKKQKREHLRAKVCHICLNQFKPRDIKVRDQCHYTGEYKAAAYSLCILWFKVLGHIPVIFHNLSGYDAHLFIRELGNHMRKAEVIAKTKEDYISFSAKVKVGKRIDKNGVTVLIKIDLRFIDRFKFMSSSLDLLVNNLSRGGHKFRGFMGYTQAQ